MIALMLFHELVCYRSICPPIPLLSNKFPLSTVQKIHFYLSLTESGKMIVKTGLVAVKIAFRPTLTKSLSSHHILNAFGRTKGVLGVGVIESITKRLMGTSS
jgi:hypothetical protein